MKTRPFTKLILLHALALLGGALASFAAPPPDVLYVGDGSTNTVRRFNAATGQAVVGGDAAGVYVQPESGGLIGPRGLVPLAGKLFVVNQNVGQPLNGEILRYALPKGAFARALVANADANAPYLPRGLVAWKNVFYVADFLAPDDHSPGKLLAFGGAKGNFLGDFVPPAQFAYAFRPRGLVIGPNGLLYVASCPTIFPDRLGDGGQVLVFDPKTLDFIGAFINDAGGVGKLNHPEGLVFGPDGNLYVTSFPADGMADTDSIRIYDGSTGVFLDKIDLDTSGGARAYAQALLFGPGGKLYVPITGGDLTTAGAIRRYDVATKQFDLLVPAGGAGQPWYLTFGRTNPGTLAYH